MKWIDKLLILLLLIGLACARGPRPEPVHATDRNARLVYRVLWFGSREQWINTPWYRMNEDMIEWPHRVVISVDGAACLMDDRDVNEPQPENYFACKGTWRLRRW
jgi:hypothetical protein